MPFYHIIVACALMFVGCVADCFARIPAPLYQGVRQYAVLVESVGDEGSFRRELTSAVAGIVTDLTGAVPVTEGVIAMVANPDTLAVTVHVSVRRDGSSTIVAISARPFRYKLSGDLVFSGAPVAFVAPSAGQALAAAETSGLLRSIIGSALGRD